MLPLNTVLQDRYRIVRQLGKGGMGAVYEAVDQRLSSIVAIKETLVISEDARRAFEREASLLANLRHRSLPNVTDHFAEDQGQFLVMQFIPGEDLAQLLELRQRAFAASDVVRWADEILNALDYLHSHNPPILHRDIKPANIKLTREGELFLIDFGLSKGAAGQMPTLVTSRSVKGYTPAYAPLEQIHGGGTDPRSDLYSVGATLYHLLTDIPPADAPTRFNALDDLQADPMLPADAVNPQVPHALAQVLSQAMAMNRRHRPANATAMRRMLREAVPLPVEDAVTMRKESAPSKPSAAVPFVPPTEAAPTTSPLSSARETQSPEPDPASVESQPKVTREPPPVTVQAASNPVEPSAPIPATLGSTVLPAPSPSARVPPGKRIDTPVVVVLLAIGILVVLGVGSILIIPWVSRRNAMQNQQAATPSSAAAQSPDTKLPDFPTKKYFTGSFDVGKALELIYGSYDSQKKYVKWGLTADDLKNSPLAAETGGFGPGTVYTASNFLKSYTQGGRQRYLLITETVPAKYDCHACAPIIGGAVFSQVGDNWQLETDTKIISTMGSWGGAPEGKLVKIGPDRYGVLYQPGYTGQGITSEIAVMIAETADKLAEVLDVKDYSGDNGGTCGEGLATCYSFTSKLEFIPGANADYYDAKITTTGTKEDDNGVIRSANAVKKYTFADGKYSLAK
jgi:serine/threonine protein kinase